MVGAVQAPTAAERAHMDRVQALGCIACRMEGWTAPAEIHHVTDGQRRIGHRAVLPLCAWHHRGQTESGVRPGVAEQLFGPSYARNPSAFEDRYGTQATLLTKVERRLYRRCVGENGNHEQGSHP